jgi:hypothetical protein
MLPVLVVKELGITLPGISPELSNNSTPNAVLADAITAFRATNADCMSLRARLGSSSGESTLAVDMVVPVGNVIVCPLDIYCAYFIPL